jgi:hypothetical protein
MKEIFLKTKQLPLPVPPSSLLGDSAVRISRGLVDESGVFLCQYHSTMVLCAYITWG